MIQATLIRKGMVLDLDGDLLSVLEFRHLTQGNKRGHIQLRLRSLTKGNSLNKKLRSEDRVELAELDEKEMEYLYDEGDKKVFMDKESYEQVPLGSDVLGDAALYIAPGIPIKVSFYQEAPVMVNLPAAMTFKVVDTAPGIKGDSVSNIYKPAKLESGLEIQVPNFVSNDDRVKVDTREGKYLERVQ